MGLVIGYVLVDEGIQCYYCVQFCFIGVGCQDQFVVVSCQWFSVDYVVLFELCGKLGFVWVEVLLYFFDGLGIGEDDGKDYDVFLISWLVGWL